MTLGTPPHIRKLLLCGSRQARPISQSSSDIRTPLSGGRQSVETVGFYGPPDGSPRFGKTPIRGVASLSISPSTREVPVSVPVEVRRPVNSRGVFSGTELSVTKCLPEARVALALPNPLPVRSVRAAPSRLSRGESQPPIQVVRQSLQQPGREAVVNRGKRPTPVLSKSAVPCRLEVSMPVRSPERKTMVSKGQTSLKLGSPLCSTALCLPERPKAAPSKHAIPFRFPKDESVTIVGHEAAGKVKQLSRAVYDDRLSCERPERCLERSFECSDTKRGLVVERAQTHLFPDEEGEERQACVAIVNKISEVSKAAHPPESPVPLAMPAAVPALPTQVVSLHQPETPPSMEVALLPERLARKQSPSPVPSGIAEGGQLERAASYIRERINRCSLISEKFGRRAPGKPPDEVAETVTEAPRQPVDVVAEESRASVVSSPMLKHERADRPSWLEAEGICQTLALGKAYIPPHSSPGVTPLLPTFDVPGIDIKRGGRKLFTEAAHPNRHSDEHSSSGWEPVGWAPDGPKPPNAAGVLERGDRHFVGIKAILSLCASSALAVPPGAAHDILGQSTSADAPRSCSFPVTCQLADESRRYEAAHHTLPVLPPVVLLWVGSRRHLNIGLVWRAHYKMPYAQGTSRQCYNDIVNKNGYINTSAGRSPSFGAALEWPVYALRKRASANAPCSRSFPVILQSADVSRRCETSIVSISVKKSAGRQRSPFAGVAYYTPPIIRLAAPPWVKKSLPPEYWARLESPLWTALCAGHKSTTLRWRRQWKLKYEHQMLTFERGAIYTAPMPLQRPMPAPSKGAIPPRPVVSVSAKKPERKAMVNKGETGVGSFSPMCPAAPMLPKHSASSLSKRAIAPHLPNDESGLIVEAAAVRRKSSVIRNKEMGSDRNAHRIAKARSRALVALQWSGGLPVSAVSKDARETGHLSRAVEDGGCYSECPKCAQEHSPECSDMDRGPAVERARTPPLLDEVGEERPTHIVVNKVDDAVSTPCSPEALMAITLPAPAYIRERVSGRSPVREELTGQSPKGPLDRAAEVEFRWCKPQELVGASSRCSLRIINRRKMKFAIRCSPWTGAAYMQPISLPVESLWPGVVMLSMPAVTPGTAHDMAGRLVNASAPRSHYCLVVCQSRESTRRARYKPPDAVDVPSRCGLNIVNEDSCVSAMLRSPLYRAALTPPVCSPSAFLEVGVVALSVPVDPPGAAHNILGRSTSADAPRSRSFPVICQLADDSR